MVNEQYQHQKNAQLTYSKKAVKRAGDNIRKGCNAPQRVEAIAIIRNFRESHLYPLMLIKNHINRMAKNVSSNFILARRLKRLPTIIDKLERPTLDGTTTNAIQLTRMQDIGGCRVIFDTVDEVYDCLERLKRSKSVHKIIDIDDRVFSPKPSGYRGVHLVFSCYDNDDNSSSPWKKHKIEVQLRTRLQHAWATCVEMIDIFEKTQLKTRLAGDAPYRRFFQLAANLMVAHEGVNFSGINQYGIDESHEFRLELSEIDAAISVVDKLEGYRIASEVAGKGVKGNKKLDGQMLISLQQHEDEQLTVTRSYFTKAKSRQAVEQYHRLENDPDYDVVVLVSVKSVDDLKKAYPNYFADTSMFVKFYLREMQQLMQKLKQQTEIFKNELADLKRKS